MKIIFKIINFFFFLVFCNFVHSGVGSIDLCDNQKFKDKNLKYKLVLIEDTNSTETSPNVVKPLNDGKSPNKIQESPPIQKKENSFNDEIKITDYKDTIINPITALRVNQITLVSTSKKNNGIYIKTVIYCDKINSFCKCTYDLQKPFNISPTINQVSQPSNNSTSTSGSSSGGAGA